MKTPARSRPDRQESPDSLGQSSAEASALERYATCSGKGMAHRTSLFILFLVLSLGVTSAAAAGESKAKRTPLTLKLSSNLAPAPGNVTARIGVEPDPLSRKLIVEWYQQDGAGGSHEASLDGDRAAMRQDFNIKRLEAGEYVVRVVVERADGSSVSKTANLLVVGEGTAFRYVQRGADLVLEPATRDGR